MKVNGREGEEYEPAKAARGAEGAEREQVVLRQLTSRSEEGNGVLYGGNWERLHDQFVVLTPADCPQELEGFDCN